MKNENSLFNDEIDLSTILSIFFDNFNYLLSIFLSSIFVVTIYYLTSPSLYLSESLLEIKNDSRSFLPSSLSNISQRNSSENSINAEIEIYKSEETIKDALNNLFKTSFYQDMDIPLTESDIKNNLSVLNNSETLMSIKLISEDKELSQYLLNILNEEYINDRKNFIRQSSTAGRNFISQEIPRIKKLLQEAEADLNNFKISTNKSDIIFDADTRNLKLERLRNRVNEISFKELELKEFYKENHPIYLTLSEQKKLVLTQIEEIEADLPNIPSTQRTLENFKRDVEIYSNVLRELSSQELSLGMSEASSLSNVRIINDASVARKVSPKPIIYINTIFILFATYIFFFLKHFVGNKITNYDALVDYVGKDKVIGEMPLLDNINKSSSSFNIADELLNKTIYEITQSEKSNNSFCISSSRKGAGKTEISMKIFNKLKNSYKVCLLDLDYRKTGLTKEIYGEPNFSSFEEFEKEKDKFMSDNESIFIPSLKKDNPSDFFASAEFKDYINTLKNEYEFILCDTPPWRLFVDAKIVSTLFDTQIYIVCNQLSSFRDIDMFIKDIENKSEIKFFFNKFKLYFDFLWFKYQYPYYSKNYYYDYDEYSSIKRNLTFKNFLVEYATNLISTIGKWGKKLLKRFF